MSRFVLLNTRPAHQAQALDALIAQSGGGSFSCPALQIEPIVFSEAEKVAQFRALKTASLWIVTSANAVPALAGWVKKLWTGDKILPVLPPILPIGQATYQALQQSLEKLWQEVWANRQNPQPRLEKTGHFTLLMPASVNKSQQADSEQLLQHEVIQALSPKDRVVLVKGQGGRLLLSNALKEKGVTLFELPVYRRLPAPFCVQSWRAFQARSEPKIVLATSFESLQSLWRGWENWQRNVENLDADQSGPALPTLFLVAFSRRIAELAKQAGWQGQIAVVPSMSNAGILQAIEQLMDRREDER